MKIKRTVRAEVMSSHDNLTIHLSIMLTVFLLRVTGVLEPIPAAVGPEIILLKQKKYNS